MLWARLFAPNVLNNLNLESKGWNVSLKGMHHGFWNHLDEELLELLEEDDELLDEEEDEWLDEELDELHIGMKVRRPFDPSRN